MAFNEQGFAEDFDQTREDCDQKSSNLTPRQEEELKEAVALYTAQNLSVAGTQRALKAQGIDVTDEEVYSILAQRARSPLSSDMGMNGASLFGAWAQGYT